MDNEIRILQILPPCCQLCTFWLKIDIVGFAFFMQIIGIIENMSCFMCPHCSQPSFIFGEGGARRTANELSLEYLGDVSDSFSF